MCGPWAFALLLLEGRSSPNPYTNIKTNSQSSSQEQCDQRAQSVVRASPIRPAGMERLAELNVDRRHRDDHIFRVPGCGELGCKIGDLAKSIHRDLMSSATFLGHIGDIEDERKLGADAPRHNCRSSKGPSRLLTRKRSLAAVSHGDLSELNKLLDETTEGTFYAEFCKVTAATDDTERRRIKDTAELPCKPDVIVGYALTKNLDDNCRINSAETLEIPPRGAASPWSKLVLRPSDAQKYQATHDDDEEVEVLAKKKQEDSEVGGADFCKEPPKMEEEQKLV
ncbi:hypothetical protein DL764_005213 [Monosporascus ibericus]|uniref:Uncharacterized protein n=1 Tax=Monosporascus ibericus TaxID=155417 RepID=A0A4Q4TDA1_9PEZI|nr:hypothetical protein DL764_005213 [Monosporascus ibericus]